MYEKDTQTQFQLYMLIKYQLRKTKQLIMKRSEQITATDNNILCIISTIAKSRAASTSPMSWRGLDL